MPTYDFLNQNTGEIFERRFNGWEEKDEFLKENPHLVQTYTQAPQVNADPISNNQHRKAFREVLNKIHKGAPGSTLNKTTEL